MTGHLDPLARVETKKIGDNCWIWAGVHILPEASIGSHCKIGEHCYIENRVTVGEGVTIKNNVCLWDGVTLEDKVFVGPNVVFTNDRVPRAFQEFSSEDIMPTIIREGATLGANATILCGITVGAFAFIGAGSVVARSVHPYEKVFGNPARHRGFVCECGQDLQENDRQFLCECGKSYTNLERGK